MAETVEKPKPLTAREMAGRVIRHENATLGIVLIALIAGLSVISRGVTTTRINMMNIVLQSSMRGVAAIGQGFVILSAGIDISVGGIGLCSAILATMMMTGAPWLNIVGYPVPIYVGILVMLLVGACWGALNGILVSRIGMPALIVTLGMWQITTGAAFQISEGNTVAYQPAGLAFFGQGRVAGVSTPIIIFAITGVIAYFVLNHTTFGRSVYAAGGNSVSAWLCGINVKNIQFGVYVISGFLAGLAAVIYTARAMCSSMRSMQGLEIDSIAAACIGGISLVGGRGSVIGIIIGVLILGVINNGMSVLGAGPALQGIVKGAIVIMAVAADYLRRRG